MAAKPICMSILKQIIRLYQQGEPKLKIARITGISKNTVKKYLRFIEERNLDPENILKMSDYKSEQLFYVPDKKPEGRFEALEKLFPYIERELKRTGVTRMLLWGEYKQKHPDGYGYSQFCEHLHQRLKTRMAVMHFEHNPGDKLYIDFAGKKLYITDRETGEISPVEVYISTLGYSQMTYVEAVGSQKKEDFISACENALHYYGGVPKVLVPDNLKSAVTKAGKYEAELNESFADFANHYNTAVLPTRSLKPRDKALVEKHVSIVYNRIYAPLRDEIFFSLQELNEAVSVLLDKHNNALFQQEQISRKQKFEQNEKEKLQTLAGSRFEIKYYKYATVMKNSHVQLREDKHYYSVPHRYIGKKVKLIYTASSVSFFLKHERIAMHRRSLKNFAYSTINEHLPSSHRFVSEWNPEKFTAWAGSISPEVESYIKKILEAKVYPEQAYRSCVGILSFAKKEGNDRLIKAVERASFYGVYNYKTVKNIIEGKLDTLIEPSRENTQTQLPFHENIRGAKNYR